MQSNMVKTAGIAEILYGKAPSRLAHYGSHALAGSAAGGTVGGVLGKILGSRRGGAAAEKAAREWTATRIAEHLGKNPRAAQYAAAQDLPIRDRARAYASMRKEYGDRALNEEMQSHFHRRASAEDLHAEARHRGADFLGKRYGRRGGVGGALLGAGLGAGLGARSYERALLAHKARKGAVNAGLAATGLGLLGAGAVATHVKEAGALAQAVRHSNLARSMGKRLDQFLDSEFTRMRELDKKDALAATLRKAKEVSLAGPSPHPLSKGRGTIRQAITHIGL